MSTLLLEVSITGSRTCSFTWSLIIFLRENSRAKSEHVPAWWCNAMHPRLCLLLFTLCILLSRHFSPLLCLRFGERRIGTEKRGEKNSTFVFLAGVCVYTQTESHKKTGLEVEAFLSSFITTHDEGSVWRAFGAAYSNSSLGYRHKITQSWKTVQ